MSIRPILDRIVVKRDKEQTTSSGGIILSGNVEKPSQGVVLAVGPGKITDDGVQHPMHLEAGNRVLFGKFAGTEAEVEGETFVIMREEDILGILG